MKKAKKSRGAHALRIDLMNADYHLERASDALREARKRAKEAGATDQLALEVKALRAIANYSLADGRSKGIAVGALKRMEVKL